jgi:hypothetical protein
LTLLKVYFFFMCYLTFTDGRLQNFVGSSANAEGFSDGAGTLAKFRSPMGVAVDSLQRIYIADSGNHVIRRITSSGSVTTLAGLASVSGVGVDGTGTNARFHSPVGVAVCCKSSAGSADITVFVTDNSTLVRQITSSGVVTTIAGGWGTFVDGIGTQATFDSLFGIVVDTDTNLYVVDSGNGRIRRIVAAGDSDDYGMVTTMAG